MNEEWKYAIETFKSGNYIGAVAAFKSINDDVKANFNIGMCFFKNGNYDLAIRYFTQAYLHDRSMAVVLFVRATCYHLNFDFISAILDYTKTLELLKDKDLVDYSHAGLPFIMERFDILYNRALSFIGCGLLHRARDDLLNSKKIYQLKQDKHKVADLLLVDINRSLAIAPIATLYTRKIGVPKKQANYDPMEIELDLRAEQFLFKITNRPDPQLLISKNILRERALDTPAQSLEKK